MHDIFAHFFWPSDHQHLESKQHQAFSKSDEYGVVDRVTAGLTCTLINIGTHCGRYKRVVTNYTFPFCLVFFFFFNWPYDSTVSISLCHRVKCSTSTPVLCAGVMLPVKEDVESVNGGWIQESEGSLLWRSTAKLPFSEQTREKPLSVRKRSRGQCEFPQSNRDSLFDQSDIPEKSQSKRGSFEWGFHSRKSEAASFLSREQNCDTNALECRTDRQTRINPDMHTAQQYSERDRESVTGIECFRTNCCDVYSQSIPENQVGNSVLWPLACTEPELDLDRPNNSLQRKVRNVRSRRKQAPALHIESSKEREPLNSLSPVKSVQECENPPPSPLGLWQLFQSSDNMDEDFKGFWDE